MIFNTNFRKSKNGQKPSLVLLIEKRIAFFLVVSAVISGLTTFLAINDIGFKLFTREAVRPLFAINSIILISLGALVIRRLVELWIERRRGSAGSRLHIRLVSVLSLIALIPTIAISVGSALFINSGVEVWFSESTRNAINQSVVIAEAYVAENRKTIEADVRAVASQLQPRMYLLRTGQQRPFESALSFFAEARGLSEAVVFDGSQNVLAASPLSETLTSDGPIELDVLNRARTGEVVLARGSDEARVRAVMRLDTLTDTYIAVGRLVDSEVIGYAERVREARANYKKLESERSGIEIGLATVLILMTLLLLVIAILAGLLFANRLVQPISELVKATSRVRSGNLSARVEEGERDDEFGTLSRAFNRMTSQLEDQRNELVDANQQLDSRRRFTETVLAGVSSGIISLDKEGLITLLNKSASDLLNTTQQELMGKSIYDILPEVSQILYRAINRGGELTEGEIVISRKSKNKQFFVKVVGNKSDRKITGYVLTFDDISELVSAQRNAAWSDIARRIAHEIKNPLTPIKLSAERLKRKYSNQIKIERQTFEECTDAIMRQVDEIGRMVNEFSNFARMPAPEFKNENLKDIVNEAYLMQSQAYNNITFEINLPKSSVNILCDRQQVVRALTNVMQNAAEAIIGDIEDKIGGLISVKLISKNSKTSIVVEDNGPGLPSGVESKLTEPYVTTREKGTGLGLAIVKKIMEEHQGTLNIENCSSHGAKSTLTFYSENDEFMYKKSLIDSAAE